MVTDAERQRALDLSRKIAQDMVRHVGNSMKLYSVELDFDIVQNTALYAMLWAVVCFCRTINISEDEMLSLSEDMWKELKESRNETGL